MSRDSAVAVFRTPEIQGEVIATNLSNGIRLVATFTRLPPGQHGFHIHKAGDLRGEGCMGLCEHYDIGHHRHGGSPTSKGERHTGDLGNIEIKNGKMRKTYDIKGVAVSDLWGRSIIVHADRDDLGLGSFDDSIITGHSGKRLGCAIFGRGICAPKLNPTRKNRK
jgi:Cu-Zn family superoxide dismutase